MLLLVLLFSCSSNEDILLNGSINGTIYNYNSGVFDEIKCIDNHTGNILGHCTPTADGKFKLKLSTPNTLSYNFRVYGTGLAISDTTSKYVQADLVIYKNNNEIGIIINCNITSFTTMNFSDLYVGKAYTIIIYSDKNCNIKGSNNSVYYDMTLKKGWNEVAWERINSSTMSDTSTLPSDLKWRYFLFSEIED